MKRFLLAAVLILICAFQAQAAITVQRFNVINDRADTVVMTVTWATGSGVSTVTSQTINPATYPDLYGMWLYSVETDPGSTAPTDNYDVTITDAAGLDVCATNTQNRHTTTTQAVYCTSSTQPYQKVRGSLTFAVSGNSVNDAFGTAILTFERR